jgi:hypothetical protein
LEQLCWTGIVEACVRRPPVRRCFTTLSSFGTNRDHAAKSTALAHALGFGPPLPRCHAILSGGGASMVSPASIATGSTKQTTPAP